REDRVARAGRRQSARHGYGPVRHHSDQADRRSGSAPSSEDRSGAASVLDADGSMTRLVRTAVPTGFEPAISSLTGTYARPLHHGTRTKKSAFSRSPWTLIVPERTSAKKKRRRVRFLSLAAPPVWPTSG